ncbi:PHD and RING finger domain-containing protein 1 [Tyrophagus putrescentiae]|nr:PHD and RING finger domain-containing protein 1 [Tyrophagus putrescentiae]
MSSNDTSDSASGERPLEMHCSQGEPASGSAGAQRDPVDGQNGNLEPGDDGEAVSEEEDADEIGDSGDDDDSGDETELEDEEEEEEEDGDEESEEGENSDESDAETAEPLKESTSTGPIAAPRSPNSQPTCYICLNEFEGQDVGSPDSCENIHHFCLECIEEWSKQVNTCPVDRKSFSFIIVKRDVNGEVVMKVPVATTPVLETFEAFDDDLTYCEICGRCDREDRLLLCDGCDFGYHCECLTPPIDEIPINEWYCPECMDSLYNAVGMQNPNRRQSTTTRTRAIARTGAFEIVRNRILARRTTEPGQSQRASTSGTSTTRRTSATTRTTTTTRKRKTTKRRKKTTRKTTRKSTKSASGGGKKGKRKTTKKRRKSKRSRKSKLSTQRLPASAVVRNRLASILGISCKPKPSQLGLPSVKKAKPLSVADVRASAGIGNLSMFGHEHDLYEPRSYGEDFDFETSDSGYGGVGCLTARPRSHFSHSISKSIKAPVRIASSSSSSSVDLLGDIISSMEILHSSTADLTIARDGRIQLKADAKCIQKCPDSNSHSSPSSSTSPPHNSNGSSNGSGSGSNSNNGYLKHENDISLVKPSPVVALLDEKPDFELYSDIESVGDNKEESEETPEKKSTAAQSTANCDNNPATPEKADRKAISGGETRSSDMAATTKDGEGDDDDDKFELPKRNKPADDGSKGAKRRPSIRDLFGGDSDEEVDDELKQLVAQQGSINVHYPIKMPIVLKTNFINEDKGQGGDEVPISKKWIPIYPEAEKNKSSGPKWKAVGWTENDEARAPKNRRMDDSQGSTAAERQEGPLRKVKINNGLKVEKKDIKGVIVERRIGFSRTVELTSSASTTTTTAASAAASVVVKFVAPSADVVSEAKQSSADVVVATHTSHTDDQLDDKLKADDSEVPTAVEERKKVRVCKHGKVIKKEKTKETAAAVAMETVSRKRSQSAEPVEDKKPPKALSPPTGGHDNNDRSGGPQVKRSRHSDELVAESADDVNWKKLSSSSKMRNYRDGKYRDSELLYKAERPPRSTAHCSSSGNSRRSSHRDEETRLSKADYRSERDARTAKYDDGGGRKTSEKQSSSSGRRSDNRTTTSSSRRRSESRGREVLSSSWRRPSSLEESKRSHKHHRREEAEMKEDRERSSSHHRHRHRHHHHRHHHSSSKSDRDKSSAGSALSSTVKAEEFKPAKPSSTYQAYPVIKSFDSKQIYSDGDNIIINVNFKKEETSSDIESQAVASKVTTVIERSSSGGGNKSVSAERKHSTASSANNSHKENVDILSPQSTDDYGNAHLQSDSNSISSLLSGEDFGRNSNAKNSNGSNSGSNSVANNNGALSTSENLQKILTEGLNFLPRILQSTADSVGFGSQTPSDHFLGDSFMNTPTQDESHSPINGTSASENVGERKPTSSIHSTSSPVEEENDDFYDPELPLQSPDRDSVKSPPKEKHAFESVSSAKESSNKKCDKAPPAIPSTTSSSSFSFSVAAATAKLQSLNNINISELIKMANTISNKNNKANVQQKGLSSAKVPEVKARDAVDGVDMKASSLSPFSSPFNPPSSNNRASSNTKGTWDQLVKVTAAKQNSIVSKKQNVKFNINAQPTADMDVKDKYLIKLNRQERVVEELKLSLKPHFKKNEITKDEYKEILRKAVPKICHSKTGEINPAKIQMMVEQYIKKFKHSRKKN